MRRTQEIATKVRPAQNYFFPTSTVTQSRVSPCDLCIVTAHASVNGNWRREHELPDDDQDLRSGVMDTVPSERATRVMVE